jgi:pyridoxamine 5'-phosphate oxidase
MSEWAAEMRAAIDAEYGTRPRVAALATVDQAGRPRVRSVVCRRIEEDGALWIVSDSRSDKNGQARANAFGEMAFWLPSRREQFRIAGGLEVVLGSDPRLTQAWQDLSDGARALFFWPEPGAPFDEGQEAPRAVGVEAPIPPAFELLVLGPDHAEHLDLNPHPHRRRRWRRESGWSVEVINP